jgi:hypothetical protein
MTKTDRAIVGFAVAPFVPTCLFVVGLGLQSSGLFHWSDLWAVALVVAYASVVLTLPITVAVGVPVYIAMERYTGLRLQHVLVTSGAVGAVVGLLAASPHFGALLGLSAGITFWLIWHRERDQRPF